MNFSETNLDNFFPKVLNKISVLRQAKMYLIPGQKENIAF